MYVGTSSDELPKNSPKLNAAKELLEVFANPFFMGDGLQFDRRVGILITFLYLKARTLVFFFWPIQPLSQTYVSHVLYIGIFDAL